MTTPEATNTLEAVEATSEAAVVASNEEVIPLEEREGGNDPEVVEKGTDLVSVGVPTTVEYTSDPTEGVTINAPEGEIQVTPTSKMSGESSTSVTEGSASVTPNTGYETDTVIRPIFNGVMNFQAIRGPEAPLVYSWEIELGSGQYLEQINGETVGLYYEDGTLAMSIHTEEARDAVGTAVPTSLEQTGADEIALTVHHREKAYVYPVIAGPAFQTGYAATLITTPTIEPPPPPPPVGPAPGDPGYEESPEPIPSTGGYTVAPPQFGGATASSVNPEMTAKMWDCQTHVCEVGAWRVNFKEQFHFNGHKGIVGGYSWHNDSSDYHNCDDYRAIYPWSISVNACVWIGNYAYYGYGEHMCAQMRYHIDKPWGEDYAAMTFHNYGDGFVGPHWNDDC